MQPYAIRPVNEGWNPFVLLKLKSLQHNREILVGATHLKAKAGTKEEKTRVAQISEVIKKINGIHSNIPVTVPVPVVLVGDFNTDPFPVEEKNEMVQPLCFNAVIANGFASAYNIPSRPQSANPGGEYCCLFFEKQR